MKFYLLLGVYLNRELNVYTYTLFGKNNRRFEGFNYMETAKTNSNEYNFIESNSLYDIALIEKKERTIPRQMVSKDLINMELISLYIADFKFKSEGYVISKLKGVSI